MKRYFRIYVLFLKLSWAAFVAYRMNVIGSVITNLLWSGLILTSMFVITSRASSVLGWSRNELLFLTATYNVFFGIFYFLFQASFRDFSRIISFGELDTFLIKPIDSQFFLSLWKIDFSNLARLVLGIIFVIYFIFNMHISTSFLSVIGYIILLLCGVTIMYTVWFFVITIIIWVPDLSNLRDILFQINGITRYPPAIFRNASNILFVTIFPLTLVIVVPVQTFLQKVFVGDVFWLLFFSIFLLFLSRKFWQYALRFYTSASG